MSTARLREAAKVLRERAEAATTPDQMHPWGDRSLPSLPPEDHAGEVRGHLGGTWGDYYATVPPGVGLLLADTMELEAALLDTMPAFAELISLTIEKQTGIKGYIKFAQKPDGQPHMHAESTQGLLAIADVILGSEQS